MTADYLFLKSFTQTPLIYFLWCGDPMLLVSSGNKISNIRYMKFLLQSFKEIRSDYS
jgi:hypothetical protein